MAYKLGVIKPLTNWDDPPFEPSEPPQILDFQIDDIVRPRDFLGTEGRVRRTKAAMKAWVFRKMNLGRKENRGYTRGH